MASTTTLKGNQFDRSLFESVLKRRFFFTEAFEVYRLSPDYKGDNRGLFDYGPPGCALQTNIIDAWRRHFVLEENMLEIDSTVITPEQVLKISGHVDKFADWMCEDPIKGDYLRADLKTRLERDTKGLLKNSPKHVYWHRPNDVARAVLSLPLSIAPNKVLIVPLSAQPQFTPIISRLSARLRSLGIANNLDSSSASIGKRYARNDELGTPLGITIDFDTVREGSVTLRERDTTAQVRASEDEVVLAVRNMVEGVETWEQVAKRLPVFVGQGLEE